VAPSCAPVKLESGRIAAKKASEGLVLEPLTEK